MSRQHRQEADKSGYLSQDTIAALSSAVGGAVAVIRISGPGSKRLICGLSPGLDDNNLEPRKMVRADLRTIDGQNLDDVLICYFKGPNSFTGEDVVEVFTHGGAFVASQVLEAVLKTGSRQALPGEFSFRAVRNGRMSITQAQAVSDLIAASNQSATQLALEKLSGSQNRLLTTLGEEIRQLSMLSEVGIDFADQDVDEVSLSRLQSKAKSLLEKLQTLESSFGRGERIQNGVSAVFVGLPNAGKSSVFNSLLGEDRSIVSEIAGTTRDIVREKLTLQGKTAQVTLRLEDTAGLRTSTDQVEALGIERTRQAARRADVVFFVLDATVQDPREFKRYEEEWNSLGQPSSRAIGILTKCDLLNRQQVDRARQRLGSFGIAQWLTTSSKTGEGIGEAAQAIADYCERWIHRDAGEVVLTRLEHLEAVGGAITHVKRALEAKEHDLFAADLRQALQSLSPLIGATLPDDILGQIFSSFCIGK